MWGFNSRVFLFCFDFFFGCPFVICLDGRKMGEKNVFVCDCVRFFSFI